MTRFELYTSTSITQEGRERKVEPRKERFRIPILRHLLAFITAFHTLLCFSDAATLGQPSEMSSSDWLYLENEWIDNFLGAYHDKASGSFIEFEVGMRGLMSPYAPAAASAHHASLIRGESGGWPYSMVLIQQNVTASTRRICPALKAEKVPVLIVSFDGDHKLYGTWNFEAVLCTPVQQERVTNFLLKGQDWRNALSSGMQMETKAITREQLNNIPVGTAWERVRQILGPPSDSVAYEGGFLVSYYCSVYKENDFNNAVWLLFDQNRVLDTIKFGKPGSPVYPQK